MASSNFNFNLVREESYGIGLDFTIDQIMEAVNGINIVVNALGEESTLVNNSSSSFTSGQLIGSTGGRLALASAAGASFVRASLLATESVPPGARFAPANSGAQLVKTDGNGGFSFGGVALLSAGAAGTVTSTAPVGASDRLQTVGMIVGAENENGLIPVMLIIDLASSRVG